MGVFCFYDTMYYMKKIIALILKYTKRPVSIVVHNGSFHADDVTAVALLKILYKKQNKRVVIIRTRDESIIKTADIVCDVGGVYDPITNRFDHHQPGGAGNRENGIPYASVGLVWKKIGPELCEPFPSLVEKIDRECIQFIDANDNGYDCGQKNPDLNQIPLATFFMIYNTTWKERSVACENTDMQHFLKAVQLAQDFFTRYIVVSQQALEATEKIKTVYESAPDKQILVFDQDYTRPVFIAHLVNFPEPLFHIYPDRSGTWSIETVPASFGSFEKRISFPKEWAGLRTEALQKIANDSDLLFCHNALFLCKSKTKEGAIRVAQKIRDTHIGK